MKRPCLSKTLLWFRSLAAGLMLVGSANFVQAQTSTNYIIDQFDIDDSGFYADAGWGGNATSVFSFNTNNTISTLPGVTNSPDSGALEWQVGWAFPVNTGDQDVAGISGINPPANPDAFTNISFDIMFLPDSATNASGTSYGVLEPTFFGSSAGWWEYTFASIDFPTTNGNGWLHVNIPLNNAKGGAPGMGSDKISGFGFKMQQSKQPLIGTTDFLIDNIILSGSIAPPPPPKLSIKRVSTPPGLAFVVPGSLSGGNGDGALIDAADPANGLNFSWVGAGTNPVTYTMVITNFPSGAFSNIQAVCYLVPGGGFADLAINSVASTAAQLVIQNNADGSATASFGWKTNNPGPGPATVASLNSPSGAVGKWSLTFLNDTNITLVGPGNIQTNFTLPDESAAQAFVNPLTLYYGVFNAGSTNNDGQIVTFSELSVSGTTNSSPPPIGLPSNPIDDVFANDGGVINTADWTLNAGIIPNNVFIMQSSDIYFLGWTLPFPAGDDVLSSPVVGSNTVWTPTGLGTNTPAITLTSGKEVLLQQTNLPASRGGFFMIGPP